MFSWVTNFLNSWSVKNYETTDRGFIIYGQIQDSKGSIIRVQESSAALEDAVWIFCDHFDPNYKNPSPHLNKKQVAELIDLLTEAHKNMVYSVVEE